MKMQSEHYTQLEALINTVINEIDAPIWELELAYKNAGHTPTRFRWDLLWAIPRKSRQEWFDNCGIYTYLNDDHIDTALRAICKTHSIAI